MEEIHYSGSALDYFEELFDAQTFYQGFCGFMAGAQKKSYWDAYWHRNRDKMAAAFRAIRGQKVLGEWDLDCSHRYNTMLDNEFSKVFKEFREMRAWRLSNLEMVNVVVEDVPGRKK